METVGQDLRFALRSLIKSPGFAIVSTITLALAVGVNTSIFSLVSAIVFADLPMQESETVAMIRAVNPELGVTQGSLSPADFMDLEERAQGFEALSALTSNVWVLTGADQPTRVDGLEVTANLIDAWKLPPVIGRGFLEGEDQPGSAHVAMLSHGYWQDAYDRRGDVLGETVTLDGVQHTIVGVMHPKLEFASFRTAQVLVPLVLDRAKPDRANRDLFVTGRLASGVTQEMATDEVRRIGADLAGEYPIENRGWSLRSTTAADSLLDEGAKRVLLMLQLTVAMVILIACANVANMLLARATSRAREMAVRTALGAGRGRLVRQLLTESACISLAAAVLGLGVAVGLNRALVFISAGTEEAFLMAEIDGRVLAFTLVVSLLAPLAFGLFPALRASMVSASGGLRDRGSTDGGRSGRRTRTALATAQISLALALMIVASILTRTVAYGTSRPMNFDPTNLVTVSLDLPDHTYEDEEAVRSFYARATENVGSLSGFARAEMTDALPPSGAGKRLPIEIEGQQAADGRTPQSGLFTTVSSGYLGMLGLPLQAGRGFAETDGTSSVRVAVVSREAAERYWPGENAIGQRLRVASAEGWLEVVGVVSNTQAPVEGQPPAPVIYLPHEQDPSRAMYLVSRTVDEPGAFAGSIREAIWSIDPQLPIGTIRTLERARYEEQASNYALLSLFVTFALFALVMAGVGIYGVMSYSVSQRVNEIGLRMALGAEVGQVRRMIVGQGARVVAGGVAIGLAAAFGMSRLLTSMVVGISASDPLTFTSMPALLAGVALIAILIPAVRATRLDPATTLRAD
jgi:putative ABC transport system permease protein